MRQFTFILGDFFGENLENFPLEKKKIRITQLKLGKTWKMNKE